MTDVTDHTPPGVGHGVLLSIHLTSNRPAQFVEFLDRLEAKTNDMDAVEVVVKIDDSDPVMNDHLRREKARRPFRITYIFNFFKLISSVVV